MRTSFLTSVFIVFNNHFALHQVRSHCAFYLPAAAIALWATHHIPVDFRDRSPLNESNGRNLAEKANNPSWGYTRIRGALYNLGHEIARNTIKRTLAENGIEPAPERGKKLRWDTFLKSHLGAIAGADFFSVEVLSPYGLIRYFVFFVVDIDTRRVHIAGITNQLSEAWMMQIGRNLTDCDEGFLLKPTLSSKNMHPSGRIEVRELSLHSSDNSVLTARSSTLRSPSLKARRVCQFL